MMLLILIMLALGFALLFGILYLTSFKKEPGTPQERIKRLQDEKYAPGMNILSAAIQAKAATTRTETLTALNSEAAQLTVIEEREAAAALAQVQNQTEVSRQQTEQRELESKRGLHHLADGEQVDLETYLRIKEKEKFNEADLNNELAKMREQVRLAIIAKHLSDHQKIGLVNEQLDELYRQIEKIEHSELSEKTKTRMIEDREEIILTLKDDRRGRQKRLLEADNGGDVRRDNQAAQLGGDPGLPMEGSAEQVPIEDTGNGEGR